MKRLAGLVLLGMAGAASAAQFSSAAGRFDCPDITNSRQCAGSIERQLRSPFIRRDAGGRLSVVLNDGSVRVFEDVDAEGSTTLIHHAMEVSATGRFVVIHRQFYESSGYTLLDRRSGAVQNFLGYPLVSPGEEWIAVVGGHESADPVFTVFRVVSGSLLPSKALHERTWWPTGVEWKSDSELVYQRTRLEGPDGTTLVSSPGRLRREGLSWR